MEITLSWLRKYDASIAIQREFVRLFGENGRASAKKMLQATPKKWVAAELLQLTPELTKELIEIGIDRHTWDDCAIRWAAKRGHWDLFRYLKKKYTWRERIAFWWERLEEKLFPPMIEY